MAQVPKKPRLAQATVLQIYEARPPRCPQNHTFNPCVKFTCEVAARFNVCERTVRDIWNRRAWRETTLPVWSREELAADPAFAANVDPTVVPVKQRKPGRPKGSHDATPPIWNPPSLDALNGASRASPCSSLFDANAALYPPFSRPISSFSSVSSKCPRLHAIAEQWPCDGRLSTGMPFGWTVGSPNASATWADQSMHVHESAGSKSEESWADRFDEEWIRSVAWACRMAGREEKEERQGEEVDARLRKRSYACLL